MRPLVPPEPLRWTVTLASRDGVRPQRRAMNPAASGMPKGSYEQYVSPLDRNDPGRVCCSAPAQPAIVRSDTMMTSPAVSSQYAAVIARALYRAVGMCCQACTSPPAAAKLANPSIARCE